MLCDYPILQSPTKEQMKLVLGDTVQRPQIETAFCKARYETLGVHEPKVISSSGGAAL